MDKFPREIWIEIFELFQLHGSLTDDDGKRLERSRLNTLLNISLTCKEFHYLVRPILYRTLDFEIHNASIGLPILIKLLADDFNVWQYVRQVRLPVGELDTIERDLWLSIQKAGKEYFDLLAQSDRSGVSSRFIGAVWREGLMLDETLDCMVAILICLCRKVRRLDCGRGSGASDIVSVLAQIFAESHHVPESALDQAHPKLSLEERPCAEIRAIHIDADLIIGVAGLEKYLRLPSLRSLEFTAMFLGSELTTRCSHPRSLPTWYLQELRLHKCSFNACLVVYLVRGCRFLKSLDLSFRRDMDEVFNYAHLGENLIRYNQNLEILIFREITSHRKVPLLEEDGSSLNHLSSLRKLAVPLPVLWDLFSIGVPSFKDILPTSLEELHVFSGDHISAGQVWYDNTFSELIKNRQYPKLKSIRIGTTAVWCNDLTKDLGEKANGWEGSWDPEAKEQVYTRNTKKNG